MASRAGGAGEIKPYTFLTVAAEPVAGLLNLRASADAKVTRLLLRAEVFEDETGQFRPLTSQELDAVAFRGKTIKLRSECSKNGTFVSHDASNGEYFTVRQLIKAVEKTERQTRRQSEWLGGVDVHHIFFEGIHRAKGDVWEIHWGS
jgi:hypothetical protein